MTAPGKPVGGVARGAGGRPLRSLAARGSVVNAAFSVALGLLSLVRGFILAGFVSRADYGVWGIIVVSLSTLLWLKQAGIGDRFIQQDDADQLLAFQRAFTMELIVTGACVALIVIVLPGLIAIYSLPKLALPSLVIGLALIISVFQAPLWVYLRRMQYGRQRALAAIDPIVGFVVSIALAVAGAGYWAFVGGMLAGVTAASLAATIASPYPMRWRIDRRSALGIWSFSGPLMLAGGAGFVIAWGAVLTAKLALGVAAVGVIALADNVAGFTERVDDVLTGALYPAICAVRDRPAVLYESLVKSNRLALMWAVPFGVAITLFSPDLVHFVIGERWRPAVVVLQVFGLAAALNNVGFNWTAYFRALDDTRPIATAAVVAAVTFLLTGIPLIVLDGLPGFAIAIATQGLAALAMRAYFLQRIFPGFGFLRHAARAFIPTVPAVAVVLVSRALEQSPRGAGIAAAELIGYVIVTALATWVAEAPLLSEAFAILLGSRPAPAP